MQKQFPGHLVLWGFKEYNLYLFYAQLQRQQGTDSPRSKVRAKGTAGVDVESCRFILRLDIELKMCMGKSFGRVIVHIFLQMLFSLPA